MDSEWFKEFMERFETIRIYIKIVLYAILLLPVTLFIIGHLMAEDLRKLFESENFRYPENDNF